MIIRSPYEILTCGIGINRHIVGLINIINTDKKVNFNEEDKKLFGYLCNDINIVLKNGQLLENILYMSKYDTLTGVYNRHYFRKILYETLNKAKLLGEVFVICILDLNSFAYGLAEFSSDSDDAYELLKIADKRMYEKKRKMKESK